MRNFPWPLFSTLAGLGLVGVAAVLPYVFVLHKAKFEKATLPKPVIAFLAFVQSGILVVIATGVGLYAAGKVGLGAPLIERAVAGESIIGDLMRIAPFTVALGLGTGWAVVLVEKRLFHPHLPHALQTKTGEIAWWRRLLATLYGGITEEIFMRLFLFSLLAWIVGLAWSTPQGLPATGGFWTANVIAAVAFGLGHLPTTAAIAKLTPVLVVRALVLNGMVGLVAGYQYWQHGLEAAMLCHFSADIVLHMVSPVLFRPSADEPIGT